ncbi:MAG: hypothetical protein R2794_11950 [Chitinophagales bacterium]
MKLMYNRINLQIILTTFLLFPLLSCNSTVTYSNRIEDRNAAEAKKAIFINELDSGNFSVVLSITSVLFYKDEDPNRIFKQIKSYRESLGPLIETELYNWTTNVTVSKGDTLGKYILSYKSLYANDTIRENFTFIREDGEVKIFEYNVGL